MNEYQVFKSGPKKGQPKTLTDRVVRYLVEGWKAQEMPSKSRYRKFIKDDRCYFVGSNGAVRAGNTASSSVSITDIVHIRLRIWEARLQATVDKANQILANAEAEKNINCLDRVIHEPAKEMEADDGKME